MDLPGRNGDSGAGTDRTGAGVGRSKGLAPAGALRRQRRSWTHGVSSRFISTNNNAPKNPAESTKPAAAPLGMPYIRPASLRGGPSVQPTAMTPNPTPAHPTPTV